MRSRPPSSSSSVALIALLAGCTFGNPGYSASSATDASAGESTGGGATLGSGPATSAATAATTMTTSATATTSTTSTTTDTSATTTNTTTNTTTTSDGSTESTDASSSTGEIGPPRSPCSGAWTLGPIELIAELSQPMITEADPVLLDDGLTLLFFRWKGADGESLRALRSAPDQPFVELQDDGQFGINTMYNEFHVELAPDLLTAYYAANHPGSDQIDIWSATRESPGDDFDDEEIIFGGPGDQHDPHITADALSLYASPFVGPQQDLWVSHRASPTDEFLSFAAVPGLNDGAANDSNPSLTDDQRLIIFASRRSGNGDLYVATRDQPDQPWGPPTALSDVINSANATEGEPYLAEYGGACELFFTSDLGHPEDSDLYHVRIAVE